MSIAAPSNTLATALERLGNVPPERIRMTPPPGTATPADVEAIRASEKRLYELVDGILVEKTTGFQESMIAIASALRSFVRESNLGLVVGADGMMRLFDGTVRIPDVAFVAWDRLPQGRVPDAPIPNLAPTVAVEVLSVSNTDAEMARKRLEYFQSKVKHVWEFDIRSRTFTVYSDPHSQEVLNQQDTLQCSDLPGFQLNSADIFSELDCHK